MSEEPPRTIAEFLAQIQNLHDRNRTLQQIIIENDMIINQLQVAVIQQYDLKVASLTEKLNAPPQKVEGDSIVDKH